MRFPELSKAITMNAMKLIENETLTGERAAFSTSDTLFRNCLFTDGESPIKESHDIEVEGTTFAYKYPLWYGERLGVKGSTLTLEERAGIWYSKDVSFLSCRIDGPKNFRKCEKLAIKDCSFSNAEETLWWNQDVILENVAADNGAYFGMGCKKVRARNLTLNGNYAFDGGEDIEIVDSVLHTKDAFWNCKKVVLKNCTVIGEYFGWNSKDVTLINCHIESHQGFCYMDGITLIDCELVHSDLTFEYCSGIEARILSEIDSVKNPISGAIRSKGVKELILEPGRVDPRKTLIEKL